MLEYQQIYKKYFNAGCLLFLFKTFYALFNHVLSYGIVRAKDNKEYENGCCIIVFLYFCSRLEVF